MKIVCTWCKHSRNPPGSSAKCELKTVSFGPRSCHEVSRADNLGVVNQPPKRLPTDHAYFVLICERKLVILWEELCYSFMSISNSGDIYAG